MSLRTLILGASLMLASCIGSDDSTSALASDDAGPAAPDSLEFEVDDTSLLPNKMLTIKARYRDAFGQTQEGVQVDFALVGDVTGASLSPSRVWTDAQGLAATQLRAGTNASDLVVRARAGESSVLLTVSVRPALGTRLMVGVRYAGQRDVASYTVTSLPNMSCEKALSSGLSGETSYNLRAPDEVVSFDLGYGLTAAIVGWGRDAAGAKIVRGCKDFKAPTTANEAEAQTLVTLDLDNIEISLVDALSLELEIDVSAASRHFEDASKRAVASVVSPDAAYSMFADADYLLDAVQAQLTANGDTVAAAELATRRTATSLASSLQPALSASDAGPTAYGDALGEALAEQAASITLRLGLSSALDATLDAFTALSADGSVATSFFSLPPTSIDASFLPDLAQLAFDQVHIDLGLGAYGKTVFANLPRAKLLKTGGCDSVFASWWSKSALSDLLSTADAQASCAAALEALDGAVQAELTKLDTSNAALLLDGDVQAHDRTDDGKVDDLGPSALTGFWGKDVIQAELRVPMRTAFQ